MNEFADVLINIREPFSKNVVWIYPGEIIEIRIFQNGWKTIATTEKLGLNNKSKQEVEELILSCKNEILDILNGKIKRCVSDILTLYKKHKELETKINKLEVTISKLQKFIGRNG